MRLSIPLFVLANASWLVAACKADAEIGNAFDDADGSTDGGESGDGDGDGDGDAEGDGDGDGDGDAKFDLNGMPDIGGCQAECGSELEFSYIWIANHTQGTISKLNTVTMQEEGRYFTRADGDGNPSRTSVSLSGRKVAVANRNGGVTAFWARPEFCDEMTNGKPGIQTSGGANDVLAWSEEDCRAWVNDFTGYTTQRPIAWAPTKQNEETCEYDQEEVWTSGCNKNEHQLIQVHLLDGNNGSEIKSVAVEGFNCVDGGYNYGGYGGAVDADGNLWIGNQTGPAKLARIDYETMETQVYPAPVNPYGIAVDHEGRPWLTADSTQNSGLVPGVMGAASAARFDPETETWELAQDNLAWGQSGLQEDAEGRMWVTYYAYNGDWQGGDGITWIDVDTLEVGPAISLPGNGSAKGISIDLAGQVWSVWMGGDAIRYDPDAQTHETYSGLGSAYTYSDMTGWGLQNAACAPEG